MLKTLQAKIKEKNTLPTDLLQYRHLFSKYGDFSLLSPKVLVHIAHFMSKNPVTGLNTINNIIRLSKI
jgi:hypothetical protein